MRDVTFTIVLRIPMENCDLVRDPLQNVTANHGILDRATEPRKELVLIYIPNARHLPIGVRGVLRALSAVAAGKVAMCEKVSRRP